MIPIETTGWRMHRNPIFPENHTMNDKAVVVDPEMRVRRCGDVSYSRLDNEILVLYPDRKMSHRLIETAAFLWDCCDGRLTLGQMAQRMTEEYEVEMDQASSDTLKAVQGWLESGIVVPVVD